MNTPNGPTDGFEVPALRSNGVSSNRGLVDAGEAAAFLCVPKSWVLAEARGDRLPHVRLGRYVRFDLDELEEWWRSRRRGPWRSRGRAAERARTGVNPVPPGADH